MSAFPPWVRSLQRRLGPVTLAVIAACVVLQVLFGVSVNLLHSTAALNLYRAGFALSLPDLLDGHVWTLVTYGLVHDLFDPFHLLFNVLALYFFMPQFERRQGTRKTLRLLVASVVAGGLLQVAWQAVAVYGLGHASAYTVGISAAVVAFIAAFGWAQPDARVQVMFVLPLEARWLAPLGLAVDFLIFVSGGQVAFFAHLGGYLAAWFLIWGRGDPQFVWQRLRLQLGGRKATRLVVVN